jgi:hypothetical protein
MAGARKNQNKSCRREKQPRTFGQAHLPIELAKGQIGPLYALISLGRWEVSMGKSIAAPAATDFIAFAPPVLTATKQNPLRDCRRGHWTWFSGKRQQLTKVPAKPMTEEALHVLNGSILFGKYLLLNAHEGRL